MRAFKHGPSATALAFTIFMIPMTAPAAPVDLSPAPSIRANGEATSSRTQVVMAGMVAAFAALLVLRRRSIGGD